MPKQLSQHSFFRPRSVRRILQMRRFLEVKSLQVLRVLHVLQKMLQQWWAAAKAATEAAKEAATTAQGAKRISNKGWVAMGTKLLTFH